MMELWHHAPGPYRFGGDDVTYARAMDWLQERTGIRIEDWGCGPGWAKMFLRAGNIYIGVDGSVTNAVDIQTDLQEYRSNTDAILLRHVLEHNHNWRRVLDNAVQSFRWRLAIVLFTPMGPVTREIARNKNEGGVPDISFAQADLEARLIGCRVTTEDFQTKTVYGRERILFVERLGVRV